MNPLPRFLALALFVVLGVISIVLAAPVLQRASTPESAASAPAMRLSELPRRVGLPLAITGAVLALGLAASLSVRAARPPEPPANEAARRAEIGVLTKLAETSVAQEQMLVVEREQRTRAQADALLQQQLLNRSLEDKIQLGRDLHDGVIQSLYAAGLTVESARALARTDAAEADRRLAHCRETLNQTIRDIRAYIEGLSPENLRSSSFADAMKALVEALGSAHPAQFQVELDPAATARLPIELSPDVLQVAREAISNSLRHGEASQIAIRLECAGTALRLTVQDRGRGFDPSKRSTGHGLANMQARAARIGGSLAVSSSLGNGTQITLTLPV